MPVASGKVISLGGANNNSANMLLPHARIRIELDGKAVGVRLLDQPLLTIGRLNSNDVQVPSQRISRLHAKLRWENGAWLIEDAESLNGIVYQGQRVERHVFSNGDRIFLAPRALLFYEAV